MKPKPDPLLQELKRGVTAVLSDPKSTPADKLRAIDIGSKLLMVQYKITADKDDAANFFDAR